MIRIIRLRAGASLIFFLLFVLQSLTAYAVEPIKVGMVLPLTGKYANYGEAVQTGVIFKVKEVNEAGGIKSLGGAKIDLIISDCGTSGEKAIRDVERLIKEENISVNIGPVTTPVATPTEPVFWKYKTPVIYTLTANDSLVEHGNPYIRTVSQLGSHVGICYADQLKFLADKYGAPTKRISFAYPDNEYGKSVHKAFVSSLAKMGLKDNLILELPFNYMATDLTSTVLKIKEADPSFHVQMAYLPDGKLFHDACYSIGFHPWLLGGAVGFNHPDLWKMLGEKVGAATLGNEKTFAINYFASDSKLPAYQNFLKRFKSKNPDYPVGQDLVIGVQTANVLIAALEKAGSRDREKINKALSTIEIDMKDPNFIMTSFKPKIAFEPDGRLLHAITFMQQWWKVGGSWDLFTVYPEDEATRKPKVAIK